MLEFDDLATVADDLMASNRASPTTPARAEPVTVSAEPVADRAARLSDRAEPVEAQPSPNDAFHRALTLHQGGNAQAAQAAYRQLLAHDPSHADALNNLALLSKQAGDKAEAETLYRRSLAARPAHPEVCSNLGVLLMELGRLDEAEHWLRRALQQRPDYAEAWNNLGNVLQSQRRYDEALAAYDQILRHLPQQLQTLQSQAQQARARGATGPSEQLMQRARLVQATLAESCWNLSLLKLLQGRFDEGWRLHEARHHPARLRPVAAPPPLRCPRWQGEPLAGKAIVVWFEQGFGDEIQAARYIPWLKAQGARQVTLVCKPALDELLRTVDGVDQVIGGVGQFVLPPQDYWVLPLSLPLHHQTRLATIPATLPYLHALPQRQDHWRQKLAELADHAAAEGGPGQKTRKKTKTPTKPAAASSAMPARKSIGLVWAGSPTHRNDAQRSLPSLDLLQSLAALPNLRWISLQKGPREHDAAPAGMNLYRAGAELDDFADTAALIAELDLVITVDTAVAHLAGAMGKPVWVLLPWLGLDWRWLLDRDDSPWYPGVMRLFRQQHAGDWAGVVAQVAQALADASVPGPIDTAAKTAETPQAAATKTPSAPRRKARHAARP